MHLVVLIMQWITAVVILLELAVIFIKIGNRVYSLLYMLCTSMLVSAYGYLLHLYATTEDGLLWTEMVVWAGRIFALVVAWRFCLSVCDCEFPKKVTITDHVCLAAVLTGLTTTKRTRFFFSDFHVITKGDWHILQYHRGIGYYQYYIFVVCAMAFMIHRYVRAIRNAEDPDRKKQFRILLIATLFSPGMGLISLIPGCAYDFNQIGFLASSVTMLIAMLKFNIGDIEQFTKDYMFNELSSGVIAAEDGGKGSFYNKIALSIFPELETDTAGVVERLREVIRKGETINVNDNIYSPEEKTLANKSTLLILTDSTKQYQHIKELEEQREIAETANRAKSDFLANMSHEIRTPINTVLGMDEMILRECKDDEIKDYATDIQSAGRSLLSIINDILDLSKIEAGKMEIIPGEYDVSSTINDVINMVRFRAADKGLDFNPEISSDIPSRLYGDDIRIRQILTNLLTNAVKYTNEGSVSFKVTVAENTGEDKESVLLHFEIEDTGMGIKPEDREKLFSEFERLDLEKNRSIEGTGLGIPITMKLLELMGSKLMVESEYGKGSCFSFDLRQKIMDDTPIGNFEESLRKHSLLQHTYNRSFVAPEANVFLVDDNSMNRKVFISLLKQTGIAIDETDNGDSAVTMASERYYDVIFMDHMMPGTDGVEAMKKIRAVKNGPCENTPIIVLTANAVVGAKEHYFEMGFDGFLSKPIAPDKLEEVLMHTLPPDKVEPVHENSAAPETTGNTPVDIDELPVISGLDWKVAMMHLQKKEIVDTVLEEFEITIDQQADKLQSFKDGLPETFGDYRILVHAMKSSSGSVGIIPLSGMAAILENAAAEENEDIINGMHDIFINEWRSYKEKIGAYLKADDSDEEKAKVSDDALRSLLGMLKFAMDDMDIDGADEAIKKLSAYELPENVDSRFDELKTAVAQLDQETTAGIIDSFMKGLNG